MAYNEQLADRIREALQDQPRIEEKPMMGGLTFMVNDKMCVGVFHDDLMCRINPDVHAALVERPGCRTMELGKRPMKGYVLVDDTGMRSPKDFAFWINQCLEYNKISRSSRKPAATKPRTPRRRK